MLRHIAFAMLVTACSAPLATSVGALHDGSEAFAGKDVVVEGVASEVERGTTACTVYESTEAPELTRDQGPYVPRGPLDERLGLCVREKWVLSAQGAQVEVVYLTAGGSVVRNGVNMRVEGTWVRTEEHADFLQAQRISFPDPRSASASKPRGKIRPMPGDGE